jgi:hypothetical protein
MQRHGPQRIVAAQVTTEKSFFVCRLYHSSDISHAALKGVKAKKTGENAVGQV